MRKLKNFHFLCRKIWKFKISSYLCNPIREICRSSSVGRAQPCQGWGREFEPRLLLQKRSSSDDLKFCKSPDGVQLYVSRPCAQGAAFFFIYHLYNRKSWKTGFAPHLPRFYYISTLLERCLEFLEEAEVVLKVVSEILDLPFEHCNTLDSHSECKSAVLLAVDS